MPAGASMKSAKISRSPVYWFFRNDPCNAQQVDTTEKIARINGYFKWLPA
jgi:hypothetical protein